MTPLPTASPRTRNRLPALAGRSLANGLLPACLAAVLFAAPAANAEVVQFDDLAIGASADESFELFTGLGLNLGLVIDTNTLSISPTGFLNLRDNALIVRLTPYPTVLGYVVTGYHGGLWDGPGVNSSTAAADPTHLTGLGIIDNAEAQYTTFEGRALAPAAEVLVKYAYYGDSNLDGDVNVLDYALFGLGTGWYHGDFNYDGVVDTADVALINAGFLALHPLDIPPVLPEPGTLSLLAVAGAGLAGRRRARRV